MTLDKINEAENRLREAQEAYLRRFGWQTTCNTPGAVWLYRRDFSDVDARRLKWWEETCARKPPLGNPSKPTPYGVIAVPLNIAIRITASELDDGDDA